MSQEPSSRVFSFAAHIDRAVTQEQLRAVALERAVFSEEDLQKFNPFFFPATISTNKLDSHYTQMAPSTLKNYATESDAGVSFLYSHDCDELIGRSMSGVFVGAQRDNVAHVDSTFYVVPQLKLGAVSSDEIIRAIETRVLRDVSVGFYGGQWTCSICGRDMMADWECWHIPGYMEEVEAAGKVTPTLCTATIEDAHLAEVSGVYKGSTPGAAITRATQEAERGRIRPEVRALIEQRYRIHLPEKRVTVPGHSEEKAMLDQKKPETVPTRESEAPDTTEILTSVRSIVKETGLSDDFATVDAGVRALVTEVKRLTPLADMGRAYKADLVAEALAEGVRAHGAEFQQETYKRVLEGSELDVVKAMKADWASVAGERFKAGRKSADEVDPDPKTKAKTETPDAAYKTP